MLPIDDQIARYEAAANRVPDCTNVGLSGDDRDLYAVFEALIADMQAHMPPFACRDGCNQCCYSPPMVSSVEWGALYPFLLAMPDAELAPILDMAETLRPLTNEIAVLRSQRLDDDNPQPPGMAVQCPFLVRGSCSVYAVRPLVCRGYGYTFFSDSEGAGLFGSLLAKRHLDATFPREEPFALPTFHHFHDHLLDMNDAVGGTQAYLPQWLWTHLENGRLKPQITLQPDFPETWQLGTTGAR